MQVFFDLIINEVFKIRKFIFFQFVKIHIFNTTFISLLPKLYQLLSTHKHRLPLRILFFLLCIRLVFLLVSFDNSVNVKLSKCYLFIEEIAEIPVVPWVQIPLAYHLLTSQLTSVLHTKRLVHLVFASVIKNHELGVLHIVTALHHTAMRFLAKAHVIGIVTLGMKPSRPETGYGYIQADLTTPTVRNKEIFPVESFREKPDKETATRYISQNNYFWNAGIFVWSVETIVNAFRLYAPTINRIFESLAPVYATPDEQKEIDRLYPECENISVDYAIMEKVEEIYVHPAEFGWSDVGTWGSLWTLTPHDQNGNTCLGENITMVESEGCIVHTTEERRVVIQGLKDYIVAEKNNTLLIFRKSDEQRIKNFVYIQTFARQAKVSKLSLVFWLTDTVK